MGSKNQKPPFVIMNPELLTQEDIDVIDQFFQECEANATNNHELGQVDINPDSLTIILAVLASRLIKRISSIREIEEIAEKGELDELYVLSSVQKAVLEASSNKQLTEAINLMKSLVKIAELTPPFSNISPKIN